MQKLSTVQYNTWYEKYPKFTVQLQVCHCDKYMILQTG